MQGAFERGGPHGFEVLSLITFLSGCQRTSIDVGAAEQESSPKATEAQPLREQAILDLPKRMTVEELFLELWPVEVVDLSSFFYPSVVDDHATMACPHPADGETLARGDYANVRVRSMQLFRFGSPNKIDEPAV